MPAWSAASVHGDHRGVLGDGLIQRRDRHGLRCGHRGKADANREQGGSKYLHRLFLSVVGEENTPFQKYVSAFTNDGDGGASDGGGASASGGDASDDANADASGGGGASALPQA